jgi:chemotaxis methyl-accepting protein methylase
MKDEQFRELLQEFGLSWKGYRKVRHGVIKRIRRHMESLGIRSFTEYLDALDRSPDNRNECELLLCVSISRFFRDRKLWAILEEEVLPSLIDKDPAGVKVWCAGCARGEEVYTFKILWDRLKERFDLLPELTLFATDMNPGYLARAREGAYEAGSLREVSGKIRERYFEYEVDSETYRVRSDMKKGILWKNQPLRSAPPARDFDLIFLRNNVLTYGLEPDRTEIFDMVSGSLAPNAWLAVGSHETLPVIAPSSISHSHCPFLYKFRP